ncbi:MAG: hypothetical protein ACOY5V_10950, partial [Pseudomonadota bacterium]
MDVFEFREHLVGEYEKFTRSWKYPDFCVLRLVEKWDKHLSTAGRFGRFSRTGNRPAVGKCVAA